MRVTTIVLVGLAVLSVLGVAATPLSYTQTAEARPACPWGTTWVLVTCVWDPSRCRIDEDLSFSCW